MAWGLVRIVIFTTAFLVGLLLMRSAHASVDFVITVPRSEHSAGTNKCGDGNFILTDTHDRVTAAVQQSGM